MSLSRTIMARGGAVALLGIGSLVGAAPSTTPAQFPSAVKRAVAHRGASAYAPEHTAAAYRLAITQGADYVEQDLAVTRDGVLVCLHDESLERTTDVEERFPERASTDERGRKRWMVADFTLAEIKTLDAGSWFSPKFAGERVLTWDEAVALVRGRAAMFPELKSPALYRSRNLDIVALFALDVKRRGLDRAARATLPELRVQSFAEQAVRELAVALPDVPRTFLFGRGEPARRWLSSESTVRELAGFANDLGPAKALVEDNPSLVAWAHRAGMTVTPYTFGAASGEGHAELIREMEHFLFDLGVDALFTNNPDLFPRRRAGVHQSAW